MEDDAIRTLVTRLARPHASGGVVVERAGILAEGADFAAVMAWVVAHGGEPEATPLSPVTSGGLHGGRLSHSGTAQARLPLRFVLPPGTLAEPALT